MRLILIALLATLVGCSSITSQLRDNVSDVSSVASTIGCSILTGGTLPLCAAVGVGTGVAINTVTQADATAIDVIDTVPPEQRAEVLKHHDKWMFIEQFLELIAWMAAGLFVIVYLLPSPREMYLSWKRRKLEKNVMNRKDITMKDLE